MNIIIIIIIISDFATGSKDGTIVVWNTLADSFKPNNKNNTNNDINSNCNNNNDTNSNNNSDNDNNNIDL